MGRFPMTWATWTEGVENFYRLEETLKARMAEGQPLTEDEQAWFTHARNITARYERNGRKKRP